MRKFLVNAATGLLLGSVIFTAAWSIRSLAGWASLESVAVEQIESIEEAEQVERFDSVESYFKASNPHPLSHRRGLQLFDRDVSNVKRSAVLLRDGGCLVCGSTENLECDHRIALMNGGDNSIENLGTLCDDCHKQKTRYDWSIKRRRRKEERHLRHDD